MRPTRYKSARTLVRPIGRLPNEPKPEFRDKLRRVREHFERFNVDAADLCQWLMGLRPNAKNGDPATVPFWRFFLEPEFADCELDEKETDRLRSTVFDAASGLAPLESLKIQSLPNPVRDSLTAIVGRARTSNTRQLFERMRGMFAPHRMVLLKSAAEWIVARYQRGMDNWERQHAEWELERQAWEGEHPALTPDVRKLFTEIFISLNEHPDGTGTPGVRRKNPRICSWDRLKLGKDNCVYAGQKGHGPQCWEFSQFVAAQKNGGTIKKFFIDTANRFLAIRREIEKPEVKRKLKTSPR